MKKALKIFAFVIMLVSVFTLSAFAQDKTIEWDLGYEDSEREIFCYGGELELGNNKVSSVNKPDKYNYIFYEDLVYYEFDVEQSGYYNIEFVSENFNGTSYISQDIRNNVVYGDEEYFLFDEDGFKVYLEEGNCIFGLVFYYDSLSFSCHAYEGELNIEFIAEEIADLQIEDEYLEDIILGYHIDTDYDEENTCGIPAKGKLVFDNGKEMEFDECLTAKYDEDIAPGENEITFVLPNYQKKFTVLIKTIDDFIKNIEIGNAEEVAVVKELFVPDVVYAIAPERFELILTMPDGTKKTEYIDYYYDIELKGEKLLTVWCEYYQKEDGNWYLTVELGAKEYLRIPCKTIPASFTENYVLYLEGVMEYASIMVDDSAWYFTDALDLFSDLSVKERIDCISNAFASIGNYYSEVYKLTEMFINYVL